VVEVSGAVAPESIEAVAVLVLSVDRVAVAQFGARWEGGSHGDRPAERPCADPWVAVPLSPPAAVPQCADRWAVASLPAQGATLPCVGLLAT
jgi:hypothetical protein